MGTSQSSKQGVDHDQQGAAAEDPFGVHPTYDMSHQVGSPLSYGIQSPMEPPQQQTAPPAALGERPTYSYTDIPGNYTSQPQMFPTVIFWPHGGRQVEVEGSFDNWTTRQPLQISGKDYTVVKLLPAGVYQYKFIVDGEWKYDPEQPAMFDEMGNVNNVIEVQEYTPDDCQAIASFNPPESPPESYTCEVTTNPEDYAKGPPPMPPQLNLTLLNVNAPVHDDNKSLPRPQHVILDHLYCHSSPEVSALVMGSTWRYRSKYVTSVMYKPAKRPASAGPPGPG